MEVQNGLTTIEMVELEKECYHLILDGGKHKVVIDFLMGNGLRKKHAIFLYKKVKADIDTIRDDKLPTVVNIHLERYEELYAKCVAWGMELQAMTVLNAKEALLGMIKDSDKQSIYNFKGKDNIIVDDGFYDFNSLESAKNIRMHELLAKMGMTDGYKQIGN